MPTPTPTPSDFNIVDLLKKKPDTQNIPGLEYKNYFAPIVAPPAPTVAPVATPTPTPTPAQFRDPSVSFEERMRRNQLPIPPATPPPIR